MYDVYDIALVANISASYALWIIALYMFKIKNMFIYLLLASLIYMIPVVYHLVITGFSYLLIAIVAWLALYVCTVKLKHTLMAIITPLPLIVSLVYYIVVD